MFLYASRVTKRETSTPKNMKIAPLHKMRKVGVVAYRASRVRVVLDGVDAVKVGVVKPHHLELFIPDSK